MFIIQSASTMSAHQFSASKNSSKKHRKVLLPHLLGLTYKFVLAQNNSSSKNISSRTSEDKTFRPRSTAVHKSIYYSEANDPAAAAIAITTADNLPLPNLAFQNSQEQHLDPINQGTLSAAVAYPSARVSPSNNSNFQRTAHISQVM